MRKLLFILLCLPLFSIAQQPTNLISFNILGNSADLSWTDNGCNTFIKLRYREQGSGTWLPSSSGFQVNAPYTLSGLNPNTTYDWTVKCNGTPGWAPNASFTTCNPFISQTTTVTSCDSYNWQGVPFYSSGVYNYGGCDSISILNLTINNSNSSLTTVTACDSVEWNGMTYTSSGSYTFSTTNSNGCDSIANLNLFITNSCDLTYVPDDNFENYLEANGMGDGIPLNDSVLTSNINMVNYLFISYLAISDLKGIESFTSLTNLSCSGNFLDTLDLSNNPALTILSCHNNQLTSLDVSQNTALTSLTCGNNQLTSLEVINNPALITLYCGSNQLTSLDLSNNYSLVSLDCGGGINSPGNQLTSLDLSNNTNLNYLNCARNQISSLDVTQNTSLEYLHAWDNKLTFLDVSNNLNLVDLQLSWNYLTSLDVTNNSLLELLFVMTNQLTSIDLSQNGFLQTLYCDTNNLTSLDLSNNTVLTRLICASNNLETLNIKNTNNINFDSTSIGWWWSIPPTSYSHPGFNATNNPNLTCIEVDNNTWANTNWNVTNDNIDPITSFSLFCSPQTNTPDNNFEAYLEANGMGNGVLGDDSVSTNNISGITNLNLSGQNISDLTGIEDFILLETLDCSNNSISSLNLDSNILLTSLHCSSNNLSDLDVSNNTQLLNLQCEANILTDLIFNNSLVSLDCFNNNLSSLDLSNNPNLSFLNCSYNNLVWVDLRNGNNQFLINPNFTGNPYLSCINVDNPTSSDDDWPWSDPWSVYSTTCDVINSWNCVGNDCLGDSTGQGAYTVLGDCQNSCGISSILDASSSEKQLIKVIDILGRHKEQTNETILFYLFDDGTVEKRIAIE